MGYEASYYETVVFLNADVVEWNSWNRLSYDVCDSKRLLLLSHHRITNFQLAGIALSELISKPGSLRGEKEVIGCAFDLDSV